MYFAETRSSPKSWDPYTVLKLDCTCVGTAVTYHRRCRRTIASRHYSLHALAALQPLEAANSEELYNVASSALCWQHKHQVDGVVAKWRMILQDNVRVPSYGACRTDYGVNIEEQMRQLQEDLEKMRRYVQNISPGYYGRPSPPYYANDQRNPSEDWRRQYSEKANQQRERQRKDEEAKKARAHEEWRERKAKEAKEIKEREERERRERVAKEAKDREERERIFKETRSREERERRQKEAKERAENVKRKVQQRREKETQEWSAAWKRYEDGWASVTASDNSLDGSKIPWPTKSGERQGLTKSSIREFFRRKPSVVSSDTPGKETFRAMTQETKRWHTDKIQQRFGPDIFQGPLGQDIDMVTKMVVVLWKEAKTERERI